MADPETLWLQGPPCCAAHHIRLYTALGRWAALLFPPFFFSLMFLGMKKTYSPFNWMLYSRGLMAAPPKGRIALGDSGFLLATAEPIHL